MKISTKEIVNRPTDRPTDQPTDRLTDKQTYGSIPLSKKKQRRGQENCFETILNESNI